MDKQTEGWMKVIADIGAEKRAPLAPATLLSADELRRRADLLNEAGEKLVTLAASGWAKGGAKWARIRLREMASAERAKADNVQDQRRREQQETQNAKEI